MQLKLNFDTLFGLMNIHHGKSGTVGDLVLP